MQIAFHRKVLKKRCFLENIAQGSPPGGQEDARVVVLPDLRSDAHEPLGRTLKTGHAAQDGRFARAGRAEQNGNPGCRQGQIDRQPESLAHHLEPNSAAR